MKHQNWLEGNYKALVKCESKENQFWYVFLSSEDHVQLIFHFYYELILASKSIKMLNQISQIFLTFESRMMGIWYAVTSFLSFAKIFSSEKGKRKLSMIASYRERLERFYSSCWGKILKGQVSMGNSIRELPSSYIFFLLLFCVGWKILEGL